MNSRTPLPAEWAAVLIGISCLLTVAANAAPGDTELVSLTLDGKGANAYSGGMSPDGRYVLFTAASTNVVAGGNPANALILKDRLLGTSRALKYNDSAGAASVSADGRFVAFATGLSLESNDTNGMDDAYVYDTKLGQTVLASQSSGGAIGNGWTDAQVISANGRYVVFESDSSTLVPGDTNGGMDIFVRDLQSGTTERVSVSSAEAQADSSSFNPSISGDGRYVIFHSGARNLVSGDTNGEDDVFVRDRLNGTTERVSVSSSGAQSNGGSGTAAYLQSQISADGRYVVFSSSATNLVPNDTNGRRDAFIRDRQLGLTEIVNVSSTEVQGNADAGGATVSSDGRFVAFSSAASNLVSSDLNGLSDSFVRDREAGTTVRVSVSSQGAQGNGASSASIITADGTGVLFNSTATNLVDVVVGGREVYFHELGTPASGGTFVVDPTVLAYANTTLTTTVKSTAILTNTGSAPIAINALTLRGANAALFTATHDCGASVSAGAACSLTVTFTPTTLGDKRALLDVVAGGATRTVTLSGTVVLAKFTLSVTSLNFGRQAVGTVSDIKWVQVRNTGPGLLPMKWIGLLGPDKGEFSRRRACPGVLAPGKVCNIPVRFQPTSTGAKSARLVVSPGAAGTAQSVTLYGTGTRE